MPTFANDINGNTPLFYIPITLSSNAGLGFQQQIIMNSSTYTSYLASNLSNLNFQDGAGNIISSWLESGELNTSTATYYWVVLPNATITVIYAVFYSTTAISKDNITTGCEPNYSATYAQYDNGSHVFSVYDNFAGTTLSSIWNTVGVASVVVNDILSFTSAGAFQSAITTNTSYSLPICIDCLTYGSGTGITTGLTYLTVSSEGAQNGYIGAYDTNTGGASEPSAIVKFVSGARSTLAFSTTSYSDTTPILLSLSISASNDITIVRDYNTTDISILDSTFTSEPIGIVAYYNNKTTDALWFRARTYIATMPSQTFGSITGIGSINIQTSVNYCY